MTIFAHERRLETIEMAVTDGLTGLHNRRYLDNHLNTLCRPRRDAAQITLHGDDRTSIISNA
jgi:PleD family two-component response regulator